MNIRIRKSVSILLSIVLVFSTCIIGVGAINDGEIISLVINPQQSEYAKGDEVVFNTIVANNSLYIVNDLVVWMETDNTDTYLSPGITEREYNSVPYGASYSGDFKLSENETVSKIGSYIEKFNPIISKIFKVLVHSYMKISKTVVSLETRFDELKNGNIKNAFKHKKTATLGTSSFIYDGQEINCTFKCEYIINTSRADSTAQATDDVDNSYTVNASITPQSNALNGIIFSANIANGDFTGGLFYLDSDTGTAGIVAITENGAEVLTQKYISIKSGTAYDVKLTYNNGYIKGWVYNNPLDTDPYPVFDIYTPLDGSQVGTYSSNENNVKISNVTDDSIKAISEHTYCNPVYDNSPDPFILYENGTYYLYATNRSDGFDVSTSTDLVNWENQGACALTGDIIGTYWFWAPEVYKYNGKFYMLYSSEEHMALAIADSPLGPFKKTSNCFIFEDESIDGHIFFDDNGKIYLYYAYFGDSGEEIWVCELDENLNIKAETNTQLTTPSGWEGSCNEGPFVLKHNGYYYLTYSGQGYTNSTYSVGVAVSTSPTGPFVKQENPILYHTAFLSGTGHHCFVYSPSGQLMIAYHCHYSTTQVHARKLCINKAKFVPTESGIDELVISCPTTTPQEFPE